MSAPFRLRVFVRWGDCDPAGIAFYPRFFEWLDQATHALAAEMGVQRADMLPPESQGFPLVKAELEFLAPARLYDTVEIRTRVASIGRSSFTLEHEVWRPDPAELLLAKGLERRVRVQRLDSGEMESRELTAAMRVTLERYRSEDAD